MIVLAGLLPETVPTEWMIGLTGAVVVLAKMVHGSFVTRIRAIQQSNHRYRVSIERHEKECRELRQEIRELRERLIKAATGGADV